MINVKHGHLKAFTLVELLTVIAIVAVITALAIPSLRSFQSTALQTAARQLSNTLQLARQYAINSRTQVRVCLAVENTSGTTLRDDLVCRAYTVCRRTNDANGNLAGWIPLDDWTFLPEGVVLSEHNTSGYSTITLPDPPTIGNSGTRILNSSGGSPEWRYFNNTSTLTVFVPGSPESWYVSTVLFEPTGAASGISANAAGIRLVAGSVLQAGSRTLLVTDTNNWVFIEYDSYGGRVRTRYRDSFRQN